MKIAILCLLLVPFVFGANIHQSNLSIEPATTVQPLQPAHPLGRSKRFLFYDDDYFDDFFGRRRRLTRRTIQLARMIQDMYPGGLSRAQLQNMLQNLQNLQTLNNMQQMMQLMNSQTQPIAPQPSVTG